jgi:hypothetical protein
VRRLIGEFRPPREVVAMGVARVSGPGAVTVAAQGLRVEGRVSVSPPVPRSVLLVLGAALLLAGALVPGADRVALPLLVLGTLGAVWMAWRAEYGARGNVEVPWSAIEHVVRLPADHEVVAIVLSGPLSGRGSPEQLYFAPSNGVDALVASLEDHAPPTLSIDLHSALRDPGPAVDAD